METIILLHCSGSSGAQWHALVSRLGARNRVLAPDLIGYGAAPGWSGRGEFSLAREAAAVRSLLGRLGEPVHLVGHSYGGAVALHLARTHPALLKSLVLVEPSAFHLLRHGDAMDAAALREIMAVAADVRAALAVGDYGGGCARFVDYWSGPGSWAAMPAEKRAAFAPQLAKVALDFHALLAEPTDLEDLCDIALPSLLVQGERTTLPSRRICAHLRTALPKGTFRVVQGAGHMVPITHRDEVNALIASYIEANPAIASRARPTWSREPVAFTI